MKRGKETCRILKEIRRQIAETNDIEFITSECRYQGDCLGTCPKCEAEVQYLEQQLSVRHAAGKAIALASISAGLIALSSCSSCSVQNNNNDKHLRLTGSVPCTIDSANTETLVINSLYTDNNADSVTVSGNVKTKSDNKNIEGAEILAKSSDNKTETKTDKNGNFSIKVKKGSEIIISTQSTDPVSFKANSNLNVIVRLEELELILMGEVPAPENF